VRLRLGNVTFDSESRQLWRGRSEIHLSPKAFELLKVLVEGRPRAFAKTDLQERLWPNVYVSDTNLATLIAEIRRALGDDAQRPRFIRTVHRFGYSCCADVADASEAAAAAAAEVDSLLLCWLLKDRRRLPLAEGENILGRKLDDGITVDSHTVSRRHARITVSERGAVLEDLDSKNGTFLREARVKTPAALADGDQIRLGSVVMQFRTVSGSRTATWSEPRGPLTRPRADSHPTRPRRKR
jgi:DNA-binding winged helix-turn-helix (wHTH) protein